MVGAWLPQILVPCRAELSPAQRRKMLEELEEGGGAANVCKNAMEIQVSRFGHDLLSWWIFYIYVSLEENPVFFIVRLQGQKVFLVQIWCGITPQPLGELLGGGCLFVFCYLCYLDGKSHGFPADSFEFHRQQFRVRQPAPVALRHRLDRHGCGHGAQARSAGGGGLAHAARGEHGAGLPDVDLGAARRTWWTWRSPGGFRAGDPKSPMDHRKSIESYGFGDAP